MANPGSSPWLTARAQHCGGWHTARNSLNGGQAMRCAVQGSLLYVQLPEFCLVGRLVQVAVGPEAPLPVHGRAVEPHQPPDPHRVLFW